MRKNFITVLFIVVAAVIAGLMTRLKSPSLQATPPPPQYRVALATPPLIASALVYVSKKRGYFDEEAIAIELRTLQTVKECLEELASGRVQFAIAADMPAAVEGIDGTNTAIIGTIGTSDRDVRIVARKDRGIIDPVHLRGRNVAVAAREDGEYFLDALLGMHGITADEVRINRIRPGDMKAALMEGRVDAAIMNNPEAKLTERALGENVTVFTGEGIYTMFLNVLTSREIIRRTPDLNRRMLRALAKGADYLTRHPAEARRITAESLGVPIDIVVNEWDKYLFDLSLDQALLAVLSDEARWAARRGLVPPDIKPNYLYFVSTEGLAAIRPRNVTIIR